MEFDIVKFLILAVFCFIAAVVDAISGGGGLISLPAYFAVGFPPHMEMCIRDRIICIRIIFYFKS